MLTKKIVLSREATLLAILQNSFFQREGFAIIAAEDAQAAYRLVEAEAPALAIFDLVSSQEQALSCCRSIKADPLLAATPVMLMLPTEHPEALPDLCWDSGCDAVVYRPVAAEHFLDAACGLLGISRRLARRFPVSFQLAFQDCRQKRHVGSCINLNTGGMFVATETLFPVDTCLSVEFLLPGGQDALQCSVRVAWVNHPEWCKKNSVPCGLGLQYVDLNPSVKKTLDDFVNHLACSKAL